MATKNLLSKTLAVAAISAAVAPQGADQVKDYRVLSPLAHDQAHYAPGATVALTDQQAAPLLGHTVALLSGGDPVTDTSDAPTAADTALEPDAALATAPVEVSAA